MRARSTYSFVALAALVLMLLPVLPLPINGARKAEGAQERERASPYNEYTTLYADSQGNIRRAIISPLPLYYHTANGLETINTQLISDPKDRQMVVNTAGPVALQLAEALSPTVAIASGKGSASQTPAVLLTGEGQEISLTPDEAAPVKGEVVDSTMHYTGIYPQTDWQVTMGAAGIASDLVLSAPPVETRYSWNLHVGNGTPFLDVDQDIEVLPCAEQCWTIPPPILIDAADQSSAAIDTALEPQADGSYRITYTLDQAWLTSPERTYPVRLASSIVLKGSEAAFFETYFKENMGDLPSCGNERLFSVGYDAGTGRGNTRSYIAFRLPDVGGAPVQEATLHTFQYGVHAGATSYTAEVYEVTEPWVSTCQSFTWLDQPTRATTPSTTFGVDNTIGPSTISITPLVQKWSTDPATNNGLAIISAQESLNRPGSYFCASASVNSTKCGPNTNDRLPFVEVIYGEGGSPTPTPTTPTSVPTTPTPVPQQVSLVSTPTTIRADGGAFTTLTLSGAEAGQRVRLRSSRGNVDTITPAVGTVGVDGRFTATLRTSTKGQIIVSAENLTTRTTYGVTASIEATLPGQSPSPTPRPAKPRIVKLEGKGGKLEGLYALGIGSLENTIEATVEWNGAPGTLTYILNSERVVRTPEGSLDSHIFDFAQLREGENILTVIARNAGGETAEVRKIWGYRAPGWITGGSLAQQILRADSIEVSFKVPTTPWGRAQDFKWLFPDQRSTMEVQVGAKIKLPLRGGPWEATVSGEVGRTNIRGRPKAFLQQLHIIGWKIDNLEGELKLKGTVDRNGLQPEEFGVGFKAQFPSLPLFERSVIIVLNAFPPGGTAVANAVDSIPPVRKILLTVAKFSLELSPRLGGEFDVAWRTGRTDFTGKFTVGGDLTAKVSVLNGAAEAWAGVGVDASFMASTSGGPGFEAEAKGRAGYKVNLLFFEAGEEFEVSLGKACIGYCGAALTQALEPQTWRTEPIASYGWRLPERRQDAVLSAFVGSETQATTQQTGLGVVTTTLVTNAFPYAQPALALEPGLCTVMAWTNDTPARPRGQGYDIAASIRTSDGWQPPMLISDDTYPDTGARVTCTPDGRAVVVWERINDAALPADATLDVTTTQKLELMTSVYSPVTKQWSPPSALTANTGLDYAPTIASAPDGVVMVAWRYNPAGELIGTRAAPDQIRVATWRNGVWSAPVTVVDSLAGLAEISLAATNGRALLSYSQDVPIGDGAETRRRIAWSSWDGNAWSVSATLPSSTADQISPQAFYTASGASALAWVEGERLVWQELLGGTQHISTMPVTASGIRLARAAGGGPLALGVVWMQGQELFVSLYDTVHNLWGAPNALTQGPNREASATLAFDGRGNIVVAYAETAIQEQAITEQTDSGATVTYRVPQPQDTRIVVLERATQRNLRIEDSTFTILPPNPSVGDLITFQLVVSNTGDFAEPLTVNFYDGNPQEGGQLLGVETLPPLPAGITTTVELDYRVPATGGARTFFALVDPANRSVEQDEVDNLARRVALGPDLEVVHAYVEPWSGSLVGVITEVRNTGTTTSPAGTIRIRRDALNGPVVTTDTLPAIEPGESTTVITPWDYTSLAAGTYSLIAEVSYEGLETNTDNNGLTFAFDVAPDLMVSADYIELTTARDTIVRTTVITTTVTNMGSVPASNVVVLLSEGTTQNFGSPLATRTIPLIEPGETVEVKLTLFRSLSCGLYVQVNPELALLETTYANNTALLAGANGYCAERISLPLIRR